VACTFIAADISRIMPFTRAQHLWEELKASLWFVPTLIVAGAVILAVVLIEADSAVSGDRLTEMWPKLFGAGADGSRGLLSAIASSMITVAGVTFSITVVALALASSQYSSRILRNFMQDRANQSVLGVFLGIFGYCIVVLRTIRGGDEGAFVPSLAVFGAVLLAFVAIGFLIFFIHHIAVAIQASSIVGSAASETLAAVDRLFPAEMGEEAAPVPGVPAIDWTPVPSFASGYIQLVEPDSLLEIARRDGVVVRMERGVGEFIVEGSPIVSLGGAPCDARIGAEINDAFTIGRHRTVHQDAGYGIQQIVDIALKALSPGINDTTTAITCVDFLGVIFSRVAMRRVEIPFRSDGAELRVMARGPNFVDLLASGFDPIRRNAEGNVDVLVRMLEAIEAIASRTKDQRRRDALVRHADLIAAVSERTVAEPYDRETVVRARRRVMA
jgi:uncharacterized membrane protein